MQPWTKLFNNDTLPDGKDPYMRCNCGELVIGDENLESHAGHRLQKARHFTIGEAVWVILLKLYRSVKKS